MGLFALLLMMLSAHPLRAETLVVLGDSLSAGYGLAREDSWVAKLEAKLAEVAPGITVVNASISGATTSAGLQRLPALLKEHQPDWLLLELGANDGLQGKPLPLISANLERLIDTAQASGAEVVLFGMRLPPNLGRRYTEPFTEMFSELARQYDLAYVPFLLQDVAGQADLMQADGLHPNAAAAELIFQNVWPVLRPVLDQTSKQRSARLEK